MYEGSVPVDIGGCGDCGGVGPVRRDLLAQVGEVLLHRVEEVVPRHSAGLGAQFNKEVLF